jgi:hypothetical protein
MLPFHFERFDVVTSVAAISLKFWIMTNARDGFDQLHRLAAAEARDWTARFVFWFTGIRHADLILKSTLKFNRDVSNIMYIASNEMCQTSIGSHKQINNP